MGDFKQFRVTSATIRGVTALPVDVEVVVSNGLPSFSIVGMPDAAIQESRERVRAAVKACGFSMPAAKVVVNLAPGSLRKTGSGFDLPIAVALLAATAQIPQDGLAESLIVGELSLDGKIKAVRGLLAFQTCAQDEGLTLVCAPHQACPVGRGRPRIKCAQGLQSFRTQEFCNPYAAGKQAQPAAGDYADVGGQRHVKRAFQIAAAGNHGVLLMGPPGAGKTMLASRLVSILPPLSDAERIESAQILSIAGDDISSVLAGQRPFRAPHHSATMAGLCGGGSPVRPGELTLAHNGVLFLDEIAEFSPRVLQGIRTPMEQGRISITRADGTVSMPCRFMLVAASNPCPCGHFGDDAQACTCSPGQIAAYQSRIGGPLIDRMDMCIDVWRSSFDDVADADDQLDSSTLRAGVMAGREFAFRRFRSQDEAMQPSVRAALDQCRMSADTLGFVRSMAESMAMSGRSITRMLRVARTIADIDQEDSVGQHHVAEALSLRVRNQVGAQ